MAAVAAALPPLPIPEPNALRRTVYNVSTRRGLTAAAIFLGWVGLATRFCFVMFLSCALLLCKVRAAQAQSLS